MKHLDEQTRILVTGMDGAAQVIDRALQSPGNIYALVDGALDESGKLMRSLFSEMPKTCIYAGTELQKNAAVGPILISLPKEKDFFADFLAEIGKTLPCMLMASPRQAEDLKRFFQYRIEVRLENYNIFLFRFYDVNITGPFIRSLSAPRAAKFYGPVESLLWPVVDMHHETQWLYCDFPPQSEEVFQLSMQVLGEQSHPCWEAMVEEWKLFEAYFAEDVSLVDLCRFLLDRKANLLQGLPDPEILKKVGHTVALARSYGMSSQYDIYTFCKMELDLFPGMHLHPQVDALLKAPAKDPHYKMHGLLSLGMPEWGELKQFTEEYLQSSTMNSGK